jgi:hypothetical protein
MPGYNATSDQISRIDPSTISGDSTISQSGATVSFSGKGGAVKFQLSNGGYFIVAFRGLYDSDGRRASGFSDGTFSWKGPTAGYCEQLRCSILTITANVTVPVCTTATSATGNSSSNNETSGTSGSGTSGSGGGSCTIYLVTFSAQAILFNDTGNYTYGDNTISVDPTTIKFSYNISSWPFKNPSGSTLYLLITASSDGTTLGTDADTKGLVVGNGRFRLPNYAFLDDTVTKIVIGYNRDSSVTSGSQAGLVFAFPQFNRTLYYDPVGSPYTTSTSSKSGVFASLSTLTVVAGFVLLMIVNRHI